VKQTHRTFCKLDFNASASTSITGPRHLVLFLWV